MLPPLTATCCCRHPHPTHTHTRTHRFDKFNLKYNPFGQSRLREIFIKQVCVVM